jgi:hypothetical protein
MSEALDTTTVPEFIRPGSEQDQNKDPIPAAADCALEDINPGLEPPVCRESYARLFRASASRRSGAL